MKRLVIFTDLDGTFLDHHTYSYDLSLPGTALINEMGASLVLCSSKTANEMKLLYDDLKLTTPFIFENGGGIFWPGKHNRNEPAYTYYGAAIDELKQHLGQIETATGKKVIPLYSLSVKEVMEKTGLDENAAKNAQKRETSIPFFFSDQTNDGELIDSINASLESSHCAVTKGGRFYHLMSRDVSKGAAVRTVIAHYGSHGDTIYSAALGDSENDLSMLKAVDFPFIVRKHDLSFIDAALPGLMVTNKPGPAGFTEAMTYLKDQQL